MGHSLERIARYAAPIVGGLIGGPLGAAAGGAVAGGLGGNAPNGGGIAGALRGALTAGAGSAIGGAIAPSLGNMGTVGGTLGSTASNALGSTIANTGISNILGGYAGNSIAGSLADSLFPSQSDAEAPKPQAESAFSPSRQAQLDLPGSLAGYSSLTPDQQSSNLATQGVYGGGNGPQEQSYFQNLINRRLVDDSGNVDQNINDVSPIERSYLSQLGLGGSGNTSSILEAMSRWNRPQATA